ncbi:MAG: hypothetical protein J5I53_07600 [Bradyrhizobiaceae bacterium]|nr:hypothetical protein [Bradyrhizobiaceae bacterium]
MRYLNLEVTLGIVALAHLASQALGVTLPWTWYVIVPLATWALYTVDRLYDTRAANSQPESGRHAFHRKHRKPLGLLAALVLVVCLVMAWVYFPWTYWVAAGGLGMLLAMHGLLQRKYSTAVAVTKDVNVAVAYTAAAWIIPAIIRLHENQPLDISLHIHGTVYAILVFIALLCLVLADVVLLSRIDAQIDAAKGMPSIAVALGKHTSVAVIVLIALAVVISLTLWLASSTGGLFIGGRLRPSLVLLAMSASYLLLLYRQPRSPDFARLVLEGVLLLGFLA